MDTKSNLEQNQPKEQETLTLGGDTKPNAAIDEGSARGGSSIVDFDYEKYAEVERKATHTNAVAGLTLGVLSLVIVWFSAFVALVLGIVGIVFSVMGRSEPKGRTVATGGLVCSIIGTALAILLMILTFVFFGGIFEKIFSML